MNNQDVDQFILANLPNTFATLHNKATNHFEQDAAFIVALVNAYRTGQLVAVQPDDATVERVINSRHDMELRSTVRFCENDFITFDDAIAAMKGPKP